MFIKKRWTVLAVCWMLWIFVMGLSGISLAKNVVTNTKVDWTTYTIEGRFKISTPTSWQRLDEGNDQYFKLQVVSEKETILTIGTMPMPEGVSTLDGLVKSIKDSLKNMPGLQESITSSKLQINSLQGEELKYCRETQDVNGKNVNISYLDYLIVVGNSYCVIEISCLKEKEVNYRTAFQEIIKGFEILK